MIHNFFSFAGSKRADQKQPGNNCEINRQAQGMQHEKEKKADK
jgi:hypothetical protein